MSKGQNPISLSVLDEERFGIRIAKAPLVKIEAIPYILDFCKAKQVELLISRCFTEDLKAAQEMERLGFSLMDTLIYFIRDLNIKPIPNEDPEVHVRNFEQGEEHSVKSIARESFHGYLSHYHADSRLDKKKCDEVYTDWAYRSCVSTMVADQVLVAEKNGEIIGFGTMRMNNAIEGEGLLFGVVPSLQRQGVYRSIIVKCLQWCAARKLHVMTISTQITNLASQKVWIRLGFEPNHSYYTFHKWFSELENRDFKRS